MTLTTLLPLDVSIDFCHTETHKSVHTHARTHTYTYTQTNKKQNTTLLPHSGIFNTAREVFHPV